MLTDSDRIAELETIVTELQTVIGDYHDRADMSDRPTELPNNEYPIMFRQRQLGLGIDDLARAVTDLREEVAALAARFATGGASATSAVVPLRAPDGAVAVREMRPTSSRIFSDGDLEVAAEVHTAPQQFNAEVGLGGPPLSGIPLAVRKGGQVVFAINAKEAATQEKSGDRQRLGAVLFDPYDNGVRFVQNGAWIGGQLNRVQNEVRILAMDSQGTVSQSFEDYSQSKVERGQDWILRRDAIRKMWIFTPCRAGWGFAIDCSTQSMNDHNPNPNDRELVLVEPIMQTRDIDAP